MSLKERYPTGRKHCAHCKRWRPITDFSVVQWEDFHREIPRKLQSNCQCCERVRIRNYHGHQQARFENRNPYRPNTPEWRAFRAERKRVRYYELKKDREWLKRRREYYRFYHNAIGTYGGRTKPKKGFKVSDGSEKIRLDAKKVAQFFEVWIERGLNDEGQEYALLNGKPISRAEAQTLRRWKKESATAALRIVDAWCAKFGIPLWEIEEQAGKMAA